MSIHAKRFAIQKHLLILLLPADIVDWVLFTLSTTCFIKANLGETLSSRTPTLFFSSLPVMWCQSGRLVHNWDSDQSWLTGIETQHLFPTINHWLTCRHAQTIDYVIVQTPDAFTQNFICRTGWNTQQYWTMNTKNLSNLEVFQSLSHKCKNVFLQPCPKECIRFLCECIINLLEGNLQSITRHHVAKFPSEIRLLFLKRTIWKQRRDILASEKDLQLIKVFTPPVIDNLSWYGEVCLCSSLCVQQKLDYLIIYKAGTSGVSTFTKSHVPCWFTQGDKQKFIFQSRLFSRQKFFLFTYQALKLTNFKFGWCRNWKFPIEFCSTTAS